MTSAAARTRRALEVDARRAAEARCAFDFLTKGHGEPETGLHAERCVHGMDDPCSRDYDPLPYPEAEPDPRLHLGTGIGALYGLDGERHLWQLAGWNLVPRSTR